MTVYLVISRPKIPDIQIYTVFFWFCPTLLTRPMAEKALSTGQYSKDKLQAYKRKCSSFALIEQRASYMLCLRLLCRRALTKSTAEVTCLTGLFSRKGSTPSFLLRPKR